jgi:protein transport protein SEC61 subunit gamma-like protein
MKTENISPKKIKNTLMDKLREYRRVLKISEKPDREEFEMSAKVTGAGIILIGFVGFLFYLASNLIPKIL